MRVLEWCCGLWDFCVESGSKFKQLAGHFLYVSEDWIKVDLGLYLANRLKLNGVCCLLMLVRLSFRWGSIHLHRFSILSYLLDELLYLLAVIILNLALKLTIICDFRASVL